MRPYTFTIGAVALGVLLGASVVARSSDLPATPPTTRPAALHRTITKTIGYDCLVYFPAGYGEPGKRFPLLIFLHGSGECGHNLNKLTKHGPGPMMMRGEAPVAGLPFVVLAPQSPSEVEWFEAESLNAVLDEALKRYAVDPDRVYLTGLSMGGYAVWDWACRNPERFAAIAPIGGEPNTDLAGIIAKAKLPVWAFHGGKDKEVWPHEDEKMVALIQKLGGDAKLTIYPDAGHNAWTPTYKNPEFYQWLLSHRLSDAQRPRPTTHPVDSPAGHG
jgi:predicted peptidase